MMEMMCCTYIWTNMHIRLDKFTWPNVTVASCLIFIQIVQNAQRIITANVIVHMFKVRTLFTASVFAIEIYFIINVALNEVHNFRVRNWNTKKKKNLLFEIQSMSCRCVPKGTYWIPIYSHSAWKSSQFQISPVKFCKIGRTLVSSVW